MPERKSEQDLKDANQRRGGEPRIDVVTSLCSGSRREKKVSSSLSVREGGRGIAVNIEPKHFAKSKNHLLH